MVFSLESGQCVQRHSLKHRREQQSLHGELQEALELHVFVEDALQECVEEVGHRPAKNQSGREIWNRNQ